MTDERILEFMFIKPNPHITSMTTSRKASSMKKIQSAASKDQVITEKIYK